MEKKYLVLWLSSVAASYGLGEADLLEAQAKQMSYSGSVCTDLVGGAPGTFENFIDNQLCSEVESEFGLGNGVCNADLFKQRASRVCESWYDSNGDGVGDKWRACVNLRLPGEFVAD